MICALKSLMLAGAIIGVAYFVVAPIRHAWVTRKRRNAYLGNPWKDPRDIQRLHNESLKP